MEKKKKNLYRMFTSWTLSYVILSTVAILVISFCAIRYNEVLRGDLEYTNAVQLELVQLQMDRNVRVLRTFASKANLNKTVAGLRQLDSYEDVSRYELYRLVQDLSGDLLLEGGINDCYLYFTSMDLLISGNYYNDSREYFNIAFGSYGFTYEDWYEVIHKDYRSAQIFSLDTSRGKPLTVLIKPLDSSSRQTPAVNAIMIMDMDEILKSSDWLNQDRDQMCIIDLVNGSMVPNAGLEQEMADELLKQVTEYSGPSSRQFEIGSSVVSAITSKYEKWDYVMITQEQPFVAQIAELQRLVVALILVYLLISVAAIGYAAFRHYLPLQNVMHILEQQGGSSQQMDGDAYQYIRESVHKLVMQNQENTSVITRQRNAISRNLLHRLLTEKQAHALIDEELLRQYGIFLNGQKLCILAYRMESVEPRPEGNPMDAQEMSWFILQNVTEENLLKNALKAVGFREGERELIFLVWPEEDEDDLKEKAGQVLKDTCEFIHQHFKFPYQMAISDIHCKTEEIYLAYREVQSVFEYQRGEEGGTIISYREINLLPRDTLLKYPIDAENRLAHSVRISNAEEACREIRRLIAENKVNCLAPEVMQFLVSNIAASVMRVAGKAFQGTSIPISQKVLMEACRQGDPKRMQEELERLVTDTCHAIGELNKKEKENQKGRLYLNAKAYVEENYQDADMSVNSIAEKFGVQPTYLSKIFKEMEGDKLSQYIHRVRLYHVKELLKEEVRLEEIALLCGFGSQRTFLRIFKQYEGLTPTQYKELEEKKEEQSE